MKRILVTGADGFIGSHVTEALVRRGFQTKAFTYYNSFNTLGWLDTLSSDVQSEIEVVSSDIRDPQAVSDALSDVDCVLHLAALIAIPYSYSAPDAYVQTNVTGTLNVLQAARKHSLQRVVCTSTSETYGSAQYVPITEDHPLNAQSPYAASKVASDQMALSFHRSFGTPVTVLRPFNTYGPRQSARAVIPTIITQVAAGERRIKLGALTPTRDFTFVGDTAKGFLQVMTSDATIGEVINIGSGFEISIGETVQEIASVMGVTLDIEADQSRVRPEASEVDRLFAGVEKAEQLFGWAPKYGGREGFKYGLKQTAEWFQDPRNLALYKPHQYNI